MVDYPNAPEPAQTPASGPAPAQAPAPAPVRPRASGGSSRSTTILYIVAALVAVGGVAFAVGRVTAPAAAASTSRFGTGAFRGAFGAGASFAPGSARGALGFAGVGGAGGADVALSGTVQSVTGTTLTLKTAAGDTVTVDLTPSTTYHTATTASASSVTSGSQVMVQLQFNRTAFGAGAGTGTGAGAAAGAGTGAGAGAGTGSAPGPLASGAPRTLTASDVTLVTP